MVTKPAVRRTPLYEAHVAAGARMVPFAGWEMPVQYTGILDEHRAVRLRAGLFDVSHMGEIDIRGPGALELLQHLTCNDVARLRPGRIQYTALTLPNGAPVDDLLIYCRGEGDYLLVVNASNAAKDLAWIREHGGERDVRVDDAGDRWAQLALQGPRAEGIRYYRFREGRVSDVPTLVSRTGYTGEDGFELYVAPEHAQTIWYALLAQGAPHGLVPAGLGARDTLRLEARMALYGNDLDEEHTLLEADLGWIVKPEKGDFIGRDVLARQREEGVRRKLTGFRMEGRAPARHGYAAFRDGEKVGMVTSGSFAPFLKKNIGLAYLPAGMWEPGTRFEVEIRGRKEPAVVVPTPFYKRKG